MRGRVFSLVIIGFLTSTAMVLAQTRTFEKFQVADTEVGLSAATLHPTGQLPIFQCEGRLETASVRYRYDFGTVGSTTGILLEVGDVLPIESAQDAAGIRFVKTGSTTAVFQVGCWR